MKAQEKKRLWLIVYFTLVSLVIPGNVMAQAENYPPTSPPITQKTTGFFSGSPSADRPLTDPPPNPEPGNNADEPAITESSIRVISPARALNKNLQKSPTVNALASTRRIKDI